MEQDQTQAKEIAARGQTIYDQKIKSSVEPQNIGKFLAIDIKSGDYEMDEDMMEAVKRARARHPESLFYMMRVGHRAVGRIGTRIKVSGS